ncbi:MAG: hypothetical protein WD766_03305 [Gemmatimonadota bacterium]
MKTRREFLTTGAAAVAAAMVPVAPAAAAASKPSNQQSDRNEHAEALANEYRRYATRAALAQANALSIP